MFRQLLKNVRKHHREMAVSGGLVSLILYNYARVLDPCGSYREAARTALECKKACTDTEHYQFLPSCLEIVKTEAKKYLNLTF